MSKGADEAGGRDQVAQDVGLDVSNPIIAVGEGESDGGLAGAGWAAEDEDVSHASFRR